MNTTAPSTPLLDQYFTLKREAPDSILLFRVGDFYEAYGEDAKLLSGALDIVLTGRDVRGTRIPMAGVPHHTLENHLKTLLRGGYKVAISEQMEEPSDSKKLLHRDIVRYLTPGTILESQYLDEKEPNYLLSIFPDESGYGLSWCDVSTGIWRVCVLPREKELLLREISKISPHEILLPEGTDRIQGLESVGVNVSTFSSADTNHLELAASIPKAAQGASQLVHAYLRKIYCGEPPRLSPPEFVEQQRHLILDLPTTRNLELFKNLASASKEGSLLSFLDQTKTAMGARLLRHWVSQPLLERERIEARHDAVAELVREFKTREEIRKRLSGLGDLERLVSRVSFRSANARELLVLKSILQELPKLRQGILTLGSGLFGQWVEKIPDLSEACEFLEQALDENPPLSVREGGLIRPGFHPELDAQKKELEDALSWIADLEENERKTTGIRSLKVGFNQVFGYYLEVTRSNISQVPSHYIRKQTLSNAERYVIEALKIQEAKILGGQEKSKNLEHGIFCEVREKIRSYDEELRVCAELLAQLDVLASLAVVAEKHRFCRPRMKDGEILSIKAGRHPVVESSGLGAFVPNDCFLDSEDHRLIVLTGPNMAGKSTYLRQVALIVILAQLGSFVPADSAELGIVDRVFTRIGASDDLHRGESTFFVEMKEAAEILKHASRKSLILLDEIGRGTSTFDGLSLAWATAEELLSRKSKVLFATHYHEMTSLAETAGGVDNFTVAVAEQGEEVVFLRRIIPGGADKSYGIHVAQLAGIPPCVVERAKQVLKELEERDLRRSSAKDRAFVEPSTENSQQLLQSQWMKALKEVDPDRLTGLQALNLLAFWKDRFMNL